MLILRFFLVTILAVSWTLSAPAFALDSLAGLRERLVAPDPAVRLDALRRLSVDYHGQALDALIDATGDNDEYVRERAVQALANTGDRWALDAVRAALADPADFVRWRAVQACRRLGLRDANDRLAALTEDPFWRVRLVTFRLLGDIAGELIVSGSAELVASPAGKTVRKLLISGLSDPDERARVAAARALAACHDAAAFGPLVTLLNEASMFTREQAALGLGQLGEKRALEPLLEALENPGNWACREGEDWVRWGVAVALGQLTGQDYKIDASSWRQWIAANK